VHFFLVVRDVEKPKGMRTFGMPRIVIREEGAAA
jgi:hypothetical protein